MKFLYILIDFLVIIIPLLYSYHPKIEFYKTWKAVFASILLVAANFIIFDAVFTSMDVWSFNPRYITGIHVFNLPIEEILFFICIPFSCVFTYYCLDKFYNLTWNQKTENIFCIGLSLLLLVVGFVHWNKMYTSFTLVSTAIVCLLLKFTSRVNWFGKAITVFTLLLIPFFIVNGILTGTAISEPVVRYNSLEILNIRLLTIPVEDIFYGLELFLLNLYFYKRFTEQ